ncbi:hypothetical protein HRbin01_00370 [archaeon HR01]|nr:hypothetical protein HRbin01_00370 [archaeon HR01]
MMNIQIEHQHTIAETLLKIFSTSTIPDPSQEYTAIFTTSGDEQEEDDTRLILPEKPQVAQLKPAGVSKTVIACDASTVKVAECSTGSMWALKGSVVLRSGSFRQAHIYGPFVYLLSSSNTGALIKTLYQALGCHRPSTYVNGNIAPKIIANLFERILQRNAVEYLDGGILLLDGSLTAGPLDSPLAALEQLVDRATARGLGVLAFSKSTRLMSMGVRITSLATGHKPPYLLKPMLDRCRERYQMVLGEVYVARLAPSSYPFRVDVNTGGDGVQEIFGYLLSSDAIIYGYPETLALAHQLATFNRLDLIALRTSIQASMRNITASDIDIRRGLFSPLDRYYP